MDLEVLVIVYLDGEDEWKDLQQTGRIQDLLVRRLRGDQPVPTSPKSLTGQDESSGEALQGSRAGLVGARWPCGWPARPGS